VTYLSDNYLEDEYCYEIFVLTGHRKDAGAKSKVQFVICGDDDGEGCFLKYIIVRDLQTLEKSYFICQRWLAVEKDDGRVRLPFPLLHFKRPSSKFRSNVFYQWRVNIKNKNSRMSFRNELIIVYPKVGFRSFLDHHRIDLHVFNDVHVVLFYYLLQCF
jgi:hypothetical protein